MPLPCAMLLSIALYIAWNVADYLRNTHRYAKAIDFYKECFVLLRLVMANHLEGTIPNKPRDIERQLYTALAEAYSESGNIGKGIQMNKECLKIIKESGNERRESACYEHIGRMYFNLGQCKKSLIYHEKALAIRKGKASETQSLDNICLVYAHLNQYEKAFNYAKRSLEVGEQFGNRKAQGVSSTNLSITFIHLGQYKKAIACQEKDLEISKECGNREGEGTCYNNLACVYFKLGEFHKSIEYYEKALKIVQEIRFRKGEGRTFLNLSEAYAELGEYAKSLEYNEKALAVIRSLGHRHDEGSACLNQAGLYCTLGEYENSVEYCMKALAITTAVGDKKGQAGCYQILGTVYRAHGQYEISIKYEEQSLKIYTEIGYVAGQGVSFNNLANIYYSQGHYEKAVEYFEKDLRICKAVGIRNGEGVSCCNIGCAYFALGQLEKSLEYQKKALKIFKETGSVQGECRVCYHLATSHFAKKNFPEAIHCLTESINIHEKLREGLKDEHKLSLDDETISSYRTLGFLQVALNKPSDALCTLEQGRARGLVDLLSRKYCIQEVSNLRALNLRALKELFTTQRTTFLFVGTPLGTIMLWFVNKAGKISFTRFCETDSNGNDLEHYLKELIASILDCLDGVQCEDRSFTVCYETSVPTVANRSKADTTQPDYSKNEEIRKEMLHFLFKMIISPMVDRIDGPEVLIVPEGPLFLIPFSALQDSCGRYLSEIVRIRLAPSLTTLKLIQDSPADYHCQTGALIVGDPKVGHVNFKGKVVEFCSLPKAREEAQMVSALLGVRCLIGEQATKEEVLRRIKDVSVVHIAAHGDAERGEIALAPNSSVTGVPMKDDVVLTMKEIAEVGIRAKLVILSCCHSARGKILTAEGVIGIARAFLGSGARSVLMSLWAVDDEATKAFMNVFYKCLVHGKMSASEALHHAIKNTRESPKYEDFRYWAPFVLLGDDVKVVSNES